MTATLDDLFHEAHAPSRAMRDPLSRRVTQTELLDRARRLAHAIEDRLAKYQTNGVSTMACDIADICRAADKIERELRGHVRQDAPRRIGMIGRVWAVQYTGGWTLYVRGHGIIADHLTHDNATTLINILLPTIPAPEVHPNAVN